MTMGQFAGRYQRLSVQDAGFLYLEHAGLPQHVAILAVAEGGPLHGPDGRLRVDAVRQQLGGRLPLVPRLRQQVLWPRVGQGLPLWVDDPGFDLANHVHVVQLAAPGGQRELLGLCDELCLRLLDRARPLWELWLVTGLDQGRVGLMLKLHHSLADGLAAVQIAGLLLDGTANAPNPAPPPWQPRPAPLGWALAADNLRGRGATLAAVLARLGHPGRLAAQAHVLAGAAKMAAGGRRHRPRPRWLLLGRWVATGGWPWSGQGWPRSKLSPTARGQRSMICCWPRSPAACGRCWPHGARRRTG
jgi:diacylglycerol O-acyltransferase / wax synthase